MHEVEAMRQPLSAIAQKCLRQAGWHPGRTIAVDHWESLLLIAKNPVHPSVREFLRQFGGLKVTHPHRHVPGGEDQFHVSPSAALQYFGIDEGGLGDYDDHLQKQLCAIGTASHNRMLLMMDVDGSDAELGRRTRLTVEELRDAC
jgi:hypothetical protein